ncbi:MAG: hypothetical protein VKP57_13075 [Candidatus Sericytochromatia bacterium]|nr:hypothetical protein [Candidatus Sericytochromatia bacterium]
MIRSFSVAIATLSFVLAGCGNTMPVQAPASTSSKVSANAMFQPQIGTGEILVKFAPRVSMAAVQQFQVTHRLRSRRVIEGIGVHVFEIVDGVGVLAKLEEIRRSSLVSYAEPNQQVRVQPILGQ